MQFNATNALTPIKVGGPGAAQPEKEAHKLEDKQPMTTPFFSQSSKHVPRLFIQSCVREAAWLNFVADYERTTNICPECNQQDKSHRQKKTQAVDISQENVVVLAHHHPNQRNEAATPSSGRSLQTEPEDP